MESENAFILATNRSGLFSLPVKVSPVIKMLIQNAEPGVVHGSAEIKEAGSGPARRLIRTSSRYASLQQVTEERAAEFLQGPVDDLFIMDTNLGWCGAVYLALAVPTTIAAGNVPAQPTPTGQVRFLLDNCYLFFNMDVESIEAQITSLPATAIL